MECFSWSNGQLVASKMAGNTKNISIIRNTSPVISGVASEYYGDSDRLKKEWYKRAEGKVCEIAF